VCYFSIVIDSWLRSQRFRISQTTNARGLFSVWRLVRATKRYRPSSHYIYFRITFRHLQFRALSDALTPALHSFRQKEYYEQPRFHASFAWVLLDHPAQGPPTQAPEPLDTLPTTPPTFVEDPTSANVNANAFPTIPRLPENVVPALNAELGSQLKGSAGIFDVGEIRIRIGKDVFSWALSG
jgi:U6 snRNA phosphodiesterase